MPPQNVTFYKVLGPVHTKPEKFENRVFTLKMHQIFSVQHYARDEFPLKPGWGHDPGTGPSAGGLLSKAEGMGECPVLTPPLSQTFEFWVL